MNTRGAGRAFVAAGLAIALAASHAACRRKHIPVASVPEVPYPTCNGAPLPPGEVIASGHLRAGPNSVERHVVERFELRRRGCVVAAVTRQEWPLGIADVEVLFDESLTPLRAWKRMTVAGSRARNGNADIRRYELRTPEVTIKRRGPDGAVSYEILRGPRPRAVIGPGRGLLTAWLQRARLAPGQQVREPVLDIREPVELLRVATLRREADTFEPSYGRTVRVYTIYGREPVFADENDVVIGDMQGLRPHALLRTPEPPPLPMFGAPDPVNTP